MRVDEKITRGQYFDDNHFVAKKRKRNGTYEQSRGDNEWPKDAFERNKQFVLVSRHFYYFGAKAIRIPNRFKNFEKKGPGFRNRFDQADIRVFLQWLESKYEPGKHGEPCYQELPKGTMKCR
jgi:hypothetical protein